jgi:Tfp pilus assembly protein PilF
MREQALAYLAQGSTVRAAVIMRKLVEVEPTKENLLLLAEIYMQQGLHEDAIALHMEVMGTVAASTKSWVN